MGKRFAIVIGVAAVGVMALGAQTVTAQTAAQPPAVVKYDTSLTITHEAVCTGKSGKIPGHPAHPLPHPCTKGTALWHGGVGSDRTECVDGRRVILFKQQRGADRKLGTDRNKKLGEDADPADPRWFSWGLRAPVDGRVYARVTPKVGDGFVCRADRSRTVKNGELCPWSGPEFCNPPTPAPPPPGQPPPCRGQAATIVGTEGPDQITGTAASDVIAALGGNDTVTALAANDLICGGPGTDVLRGGQGNDTLFGEAGKDVLYGGKGKDQCGGGNDAFGCERQGARLRLRGR